MAVLIVGPSINVNLECFQLSNVERGGRTAFPLIGVAATPVKGSALFWYNILSSGVIDERTWHGACSVILGEKWGMGNAVLNFLDMFSKK